MLIINYEKIKHLLKNHCRDRANKLVMNGFEYLCKGDYTPNNGSLKEGAKDVEEFYGYESGLLVYVVYRDHFHIEYYYQQEPKGTLGLFVTNSKNR